MIHHFTLKVSDYALSKTFYVAALKPLGYAVVVEYGGGCGLGASGKPDLWLAQDPENVRPMHFAFHAANRGAVEAFHQAAMGAGARDNGPPGVRTEYDPNYFAAFVLDPDGHNVEAVCLAPAKARAKGGKAKARPAAPKAKRVVARAKPAARKGARRPRR
jgi:catechol 2,3-dioxygenase-like lactoylglutathione lyase family enzyme